MLKVKTEEYERIHRIIHRQSQKEMAKMVAEYRENEILALLPPDIVHIPGLVFLNV
jgi:hypothetical protein